MSDQYEPDLDGEEAQGDQPESSTIKALRDQLKAEAKARREAEKEAAEGRALRSAIEQEKREADVKARFEEAGVPSSFAAFYLKEDNPPEDVSEWAQQYGINPQAAQPAATSQTFTGGLPAVPGVVGVPGAAGPTKMSREDFDYLMRTDPQKALSMRPDQIAWRNRGTQETIQEVSRLR